MYTRGWKLIIRSQIRELLWKEPRKKNQNPRIRSENGGQFGMMRASRGVYEWGEGK